MFINAYYFRAHTYTLVPRHVREDMQWMASAGTNAVSVGVLEQDLFAAVENIQWIEREARAAGMQFYVVPSRWGGMVAGCPKVPSLFASKRPDACMRRKDGSPFISMFGPVASVHHPATYEFFCDTLDTLFEMVEVDGIIWDEPKILHDSDYSDAARAALGDDGLDDKRAQTDAVARFFGKVSAHALSRRPKLRTCMFTYANVGHETIERCAAIDELTDFGCDGRPFRAEDRGTDDNSGGQAPSKLLCDQGPAFVAAARRNGKRPLFLIENHALDNEDLPKMDKRLPEILSLGVEHLIYYYYPRSLEDPDANMAVIAKHLSNAV